MRICLNIKKLKGDFKSKEAIKLIFRIGEEHRLQTELSRCNSGYYAFMEKHYLNAAQLNNISFIEIQVVSQSGCHLSHITVFYVKFKEFTQIDISSKHQQCTLHYELKEEANTDEGLNASMISDQTEPAEGERTSVTPLELGLALIKFAQRIDIVVYIFKKAGSILYWKDPKVTLAIAFLLTLFIYYAEYSILLGGVLLYFAQGIILRKFERVHRYDTVKHRILFPQKNAVFLLEVIEVYCKLFEGVSEILFDHDKTFLVNVIKLVCKLSLLNIVLVFFFDFKLILIIGVWAVILVGSPIQEVLSTRIKPIVFSLLEEYFKITDKISSEINSAIKKSIVKVEEEHMREFYYYEYENWSVFAGWVKEKFRISDEGDDCLGEVRTSAPLNWAWTTDWKIDYEGDVDESGYEYRNFNSYSSQSAVMSTRRRRRWRRTCTMNIYG